MLPERRHGAGLGRRDVRDVARLRVHVVDWTPERMPELLAGIESAAAELGFTPGPPTSLIGVAALDVPEHLVEIEATAVLD